MRWIIDYFTYSLRELSLQAEVKKRYYSDCHFAKVDRALIKTYRYRSPYRISKSYLKKRKASDIYTYGETPLPVFETIGRESQLREGQHVLELGCGRGRGVFFLRYFFRCHVTGIERIPEFVTSAKSISQHYDVDRVSFECRDIFDLPVSKVDMIYLFGSSFSASQISALARLIRNRYAPGTRVVTISYPFNGYDLSARFPINKIFPVTFPWGNTQAYLQVLV